MERLRVAALDRDAALAQRVDDAFEQRLRQPGQRLDRQFFGAQFDEQGCGVGHRSKASCLGVLPFNGGGFALKSSPSRGGFRSEEHTSELQSLMRSSYAVFCWKTKIE